MLQSICWTRIWVSKGCHLAYYDDDDAMLSLINLFHRPRFDPRPGAGRVAAVLVDGQL